LFENCIRCYYAFGTDVGRDFGKAAIKLWFEMPPAARDGWKEHFIIVAALNKGAMGDESEEIRLSEEKRIRYQSLLRVRRNKLSAWMLECTRRLGIKLDVP
jgi:hypothetical protein